jgi:cytochrome b561
LIRGVVPRDYPAHEQANSFAVNRKAVESRDRGGGVMKSNLARYGVFSILIHWLLALATAALLGLGWYLRSSPTTTDERAFLADLHVSLGLTTAALLALAILAGLLSGHPAYPAEAPRWRRLMGAWVNALIYLALVVVTASGYLLQVFTAAPMSFWGTPLPSWGEPDDRLAGYFANAHEFGAFALAGLVVVHIGLVIANSFAYPGFAGRMLPGKSEAPEDAVPALRMSGPSGDKIGQRLAGQMRLLGWTKFWIQFVLAFLSALLLQFATSGRALSAVQAGFGEAIYWSGCALALLFLTCALAYNYTRRARKIALAPDRYLGGKRGSGLWFLQAGMTIGFLGVFLSFIGVALSISLLIAKTVSQPPGIAITDPTKIIRALDVFVLLMSFLLLLAHFIGVGISVWLRIAVARARVQYLPPAATASGGPPPPAII